MNALRTADTKIFQSCRYLESMAPESGTPLKTQKYWIPWHKIVMGNKKALHSMF